MKQFTQILESLNSNQNIAYSFIRTFLGIVLFVRGWILISNPDAIMELVSDNTYHMWFSYVTMGHLIGGFFVAIGIFTRLGSLMQIPILIGAVFVVNEKSLMREDQSLELAVLVLFLLGICFIFGSGAKSLGRHFNFPNL
ncbi:MAG: DoxX family protein [Cyclobacteriaceae bacterium]|nr:DoxX family protein [Cyclobacteriaceae bacterium]